MGPPGPLSSASLLSGSGITSLGGGSWRPGGGRACHQEVVAAQSPAGNRRLPPASATAPLRIISGLFLIISADVIFGQQRGGAGRRLRGEKVKTDSLSVSSFSLISTMARECGSPGRRLSSERRESMVANMMSYLRIPPRAEVSND